MNQLELALIEPRAKRKDPSTSHQAAASAQEVQAYHHGIILGALDRFGPSGKDRIAALTNLTGVQVCRRLGELQRLGAAMPTGRNVQSTSGRAEREWAVLKKEQSAANFA